MFTPQRRRVKSTTGQILGIAMVFVSLGLVVSAVVELVGGGTGEGPLLISALVFIVGGVLLVWATRVGETTPVAVFTAVAVTWFTVTALGSLPYILDRTMAAPGVTRWVEIADAFFEAASGFSCTGSTVLSNLPDLNDPDPAIGKGILFWRQLTQWYGGMGIVVLVLAVLPALGASATDFLAAEAPGDTADKVVPRIGETAKRLWLLYVGVTGFMSLLYVVAGMSIFDGLQHGLTSAATGGFSPYNDSIGEFDSVAIELACMAAMLIGGTNFVLHYRAVRGDVGVYWRDQEFRTYAAITAGFGTLVIVPLLIDGSLGGLGTVLRAGIFNTVTLITSTGFGNAQGPGTAGDFTSWIPAPIVIFLILMFIGGCTGSTSGGSKVLRARVLGGVARRSLKQIRHPRGVFPIKLDGRSLPERVVERITTFIVIYFGLAVVGTVVITLLGAEFQTALAGVLSSLGNMGPALGESGPTGTFVAGFNTPARLLLAVLMIVGRLELFAVLLMFLGGFRRLRFLVPRLDHRSRYQE
ncbi:MAG: TrkH family potassium uptake protein [Acidimicrobiales bacterium]|nr:TrkH family potassium uptake protein [Acidimicrobiales bacterium]